jgi:4-amino-4-deoxy-L-arabinose transferase-like glycosyltransferase
VRSPATTERDRHRIGGGIPPIAWAVTATYLVVLLAYSVLLPTYRGPDEPHHVDLIRLVSQELTYPDWDARRVDPAITESWAIVRFGDGSRHLTRDEAPPRLARPSLDELGHTREASHVNQLPQHPPLYYALVGGGTRALESIVPGSPLGSFEREVWVYRVAGILMLVPLPLVIWVTARRLDLPAPVATAAMLLPLAVPQVTYMGAVVNNDSLLLLLAWLHMPLIIRIADGDLRPRVALLTGILTGLALLTKGNALVLPILGFAAIGIGWRRLRTSHGHGEQALGASAIYGLTSMALGGWWWVRNVVLFGQLAPSTEYDRLGVAEGFTPDIGEFLHAWAYRTNMRFWGDFGWRGFALPLPWIVVAVATIVALGVLLLAFLRRPFGVDLTTRALLLAPWMLFAAFAAINAWRLYSRSGETPLLQGRYWFGGMVGIALLIALGAGIAMGRRFRALPVLAMGAVAAMQIIAVLTILGFYWGPPDGSRVEQARAAVAWNPLPGPLVGIGGVIGIAVIGLLVFLVMRAVAGSRVALPFRSRRPSVSTSPGAVDGRSSIGPG